MTQSVRTSDLQLKGGAAILFNAVTTSLTVTLCSFDHCTSTGRDGSGGTVMSSSKSPTNTSFTLLQSVFTHCACNYATKGMSGGSVFVQTGTIRQTTITGCAFENSSTGAKDVSYDSAIDGTVGPSNFELSDSKSGGATVYCESLRNSSNWIPQVSQKTTIKRVDISYTENSVKMTIIANDALLGSMTVLLDGANAPRLVQVPFGHNTTPNTTDEVEVATDSSSFLPSNVAFHVRKVGLEGWDFDPSIVSVETNFTYNLNYKIKLFGINLPPNCTLTLTFFDSTGHQVTSEHTESLTLILNVSTSHRDSFHFGEKYTIGEIATDGIVLVFPHTFSFTIPLPSSELNSVSTLDCKNGSIHLQVSGKNLFSPKYNVTFSTADDQKPSHMRNLTFSSLSLTQLETLDITICEEGPFSLLPDREYQVRGAVSLDHNLSIRVSVQPFRTPQGPPDPKKAWAVLISGIVVLSLALIRLGLGLRNQRSSVVLRTTWISAQSAVTSRLSLGPVGARQKMAALDANTTSSLYDTCPDCSAFLNWRNVRRESAHDKAVVFRSLVATVKFQSVFDVSLETKAVTFLESVDTTAEESSDAQVIATSTMEMLFSLIKHCSPQILLALVKADSKSFHINLIKCLFCSLWLATPRGLGQLEIEDRNEQQAVHETVLKHVVIHSEKYIGHLCVNRYSIVDGDLSNGFMHVLVRIFEICPYYQPTMEIVLHLPVLFTISSYLTFFEDEKTIWHFLDVMFSCQLKWNESRGQEQQMGKTVHRMLQMEGIEDAMEEKLQNDQDEKWGRLVVYLSINLNNLLGMNLPEQE
ncbi:hypothetical protein BLNAU_13372 [Blattamonas nauphoetae]|uniref:Uncharacterized protein n=1 Tax=Blattamonas nauphoetae TaxID=2049346 RepID=A0ABQ9XJW8_9EUKA|nr:hypothetical protein BLNAU_13372 [Blattamonas nauphoetae]